MDNNKFDVTVIGSGPGGYVAAIRSAQLGLKTAIIEKNKTFGGTCLNIGCIPSKALLDSSEMYLAAKSKMLPHGVSIDQSSIRLDLGAMMARKEKIVSKMTEGVKILLASNKVVTFEGLGRLKNSRTISVEKPDGSAMEIESGKIILATGSMPAVLPMLPFDGDKIVDSTGALSFTSVPGKLAIIGAGAIGLEIGSIWKRLGSDVVIIEMMDQILPQSESSTAARLAMILKKQGLDIRLSTTLKSYEIKDGGVVLTVFDKSGVSGSVSCDRVLVAAGRRPFTEGLGLSEAGVEFDAKSGRIEVGKNFETGVPGIFAIGDIIRGPMLAHKAQEEGSAAAEFIGGKFPEVNYDTIPSIVYTWPEYASVGKSEDDLEKTGRKYKTGKFQFGANGRAMAGENTEGFVKIISDPESDMLLGAQIIGPGASELIAEISMVLNYKGTSEDIAGTVHAHPTLSEVTREAAMDVLGRSIHSLSKRR